MKNNFRFINQNVWNYANLKHPWKCFHVLFYSLDFFNNHRTLNRVRQESSECGPGSIPTSAIQQLGYTSNNSWCFIINKWSHTEIDDISSKFLENGEHKTETLQFVCLTLSVSPKVYLLRRRQVLQFWRSANNKQLFPYNFHWNILNSKEFKRTSMKLIK